MYQLLIVLLQNVNIIDKLKLVWYFYQIAREWNVRKTEALGRFNHSPISTELSSVRYNKKKKKKESVSPRFSEPYVYLNNETKKILLTTTHSHVQYIELLWLIIVTKRSVTKHRRV